jgi:5-methylcytosine-specific restriction endonuclease McrA
MLRPCLGIDSAPCGELTPYRRCPVHTKQFESRRPPRRIRGRYDTKHNQLREITLREQPWCGECRTPGTDANPLQADHIVPHQWGGKNVRSNYQTLCRRCNAAKRDRMLSGG